MDEPILSPIDMNFVDVPKLLFNYGPEYQEKLGIKM